MKKITYTGLLVLLIVSSCHLSTLSPVAYVSYVENTKNGLRKEKVVDSWKYKVQYKPQAYIYLQEKKGGKINKKDCSTRIEQLGNWCFFNIYIQHDSIHTSAPIRLVSHNISEYNSALSYYLSQNKNNFMLYAGKDTLYPGIYNYENNYNLSPEDVMVVGFELKGNSAKNKEKLILVYNDELLKTGFIRFVFEKADLEKEPRIDL